MSSIWMDDIDSEAEYDSEGDLDDSDVGYESEDARSDAVRRARARQIALARRRVSAARSARPPATAGPPTPRQTVAAIRNLDLKTQVGESSLRSALEAANRRARRASYVTVASVAVDQAMDSFRSDLDGHDFIRAGMRFAPILLLPTQRTRGGLEGYLARPWVIGGTAVAGILAAGEIRKRSDRAKDMILRSNATVRMTNPTGRFSSFAVDRSGAVVPAAATWVSHDDSVLVFTSPSTGEYRAKNAGTAMVSVTADGHTKWMTVDVIDDAEKG